MGLLEELYKLRGKDAERRQAETERERQEELAIKMTSQEKAATGTDEEYDKYHAKLSKELADAEKASPHKLDMTLPSGDKLPIDSPKVWGLKQLLGQLETGREGYLQQADRLAQEQGLYASSSNLIEDMFAELSKTSFVEPTPFVGLTPVKSANYLPLVIGVAAYFLFWYKGV